ncbi:hypothetical protein, partial [Streptococcus mitis]|uniref:hypothetical protein n=1 Tax=Streptococcus mitis TaxID=28037 RepID=UPI001CBA814F
THLKAYLINTPQLYLSVYTKLLTESFCKIGGNVDILLEIFYHKKKARRKPLQIQGFKNFKID